MRASRGHCPYCGYDLRASANDTCPECGRWISGQVAPSRRARLWLIPLTLIVVHAIVIGAVSFHYEMTRSFDSVVLLVRVTAIDQPTFSLLGHEPELGWPLTRHLLFIGTIQWGLIGSALAAVIAWLRRPTD